MSKTLMVAQREFMENMRTKTFWIGVLVAPIGIAVFYGVMFLLANSTDVRKYAVVDHSQSAELGEAWLSKMVLEKAQSERLKEKAAEEIDKQIDKLLPQERPLRKLLDAQRGETERFSAWLLKSATNQLSAIANFMALAQTLESEITALIESETDPESRTKLEESFEEDGKSLMAFVDAIKDSVLSFAEAAEIHKDFELVSPPEGQQDVVETLNEMIQSGELFAFFVIEGDPLSKDHGSRYVSNNRTDSKLKNWFTNHATTAIRNQHIARLEKEKNLSEDDRKDLEASFAFNDRQVTDEGTEAEVETSDTVRNFAPMVFVYILWMAVFIGAQMLLTNTVEEKSNRIIEVLLSSVSPTQLMHGKIYGIALTGLTVIGSWMGFFIAGIKLAPVVLPEQESTQLAELGLDAIVQDPVFLLSFLGYFLSGYLMYAAILVAIGSVCNSLKEAQNLMQPVVFVLMVPFATMFPITSDPNGTVARIMTYIPLYTPFAMMNRAAGPAPMWEYFASSALILVSLWIAFRGAAKVFRVGVLMTGKPPRIREILRWMRAPVK